ncbi:MAG: Rrf2 family transcriptional regulator [Candidatus Dormibacteria bacterium]
MLRLLVQRNIAEARSGTSGGCRLAHSAEDLTMLDVIEAGEGRLLSTRCVLRGTGCNARRPCLLHGTQARAPEALRRELSATSLKSLAAAPARTIAARGR